MIDLYADFREVGGTGMIYLYRPLSSRESYVLQALAGSNNKDYWLVRAYREHGVELLSIFRTKEDAAKFIRYGGSTNVSLFLMFDVDEELREEIKKVTFRIEQPIEFVLKIKSAVVKQVRE